jgi:GDPmannose 4,6-dehydratase
MKIAIISGITGQDGSLLAALLLSKQYRVIGLVPIDRDSDLFRIQFLNIEDKITLKKVDLLNSESVNKVVEELQPDEF